MTIATEPPNIARQLIIMMMAFNRPDSTALFTSIGFDDAAACYCLSEYASGASPIGVTISIEATHLCVSSVTKTILRTFSVILYSFRVPPLPSFSHLAHLPRMRCPPLTDRRTMAYFAVPCPAVSGLFVGIILVEGFYFTTSCTPLCGKERITDRISLHFRPPVSGCHAGGTRNAARTCY
jgi:hypothetical protein